MKLIGLTIAAGLAGTMALSTPAVAQMRHVEVSRSTTTTTVHNDDRVIRHRARHKVCKTQWRNHHKVRNCWWAR